jgi:hypothetical protein
VVVTERERRRTINLRRPERARNEGSTGPHRLDDTRCTTYRDWKISKSAEIDENRQVPRRIKISERPPSVDQMPVYRRRITCKGFRCRANMPHARESRPHSDASFQAKALSTFRAGPERRPGRTRPPEALAHSDLTQCIKQLVLESQLRHNTVNLMS